MTPEPADISDLISTLRELPIGHPIGHLLRNTPDFRDDDALADALLNPRDRSYTVPSVLELIDGAGLRFSRWVRQAPVPTPVRGFDRSASTAGELRHCQSPISSLRSSCSAAPCNATASSSTVSDSPLPTSPIRWDDDAWGRYVPIRPTTVTVVEERLPAGVAGVLINQAHTDRDLVLFLDEDARRIIRTDRRQADDSALSMVPPQVCSSASGGTTSR